MLNLDEIRFVNEKRRFVRDKGHTTQNENLEQILGLVLLQDDAPEVIEMLITELERLYEEIRHLREVMAGPPTITISGQRWTVTERTMTGAAIKAMAGVRSDYDLFYNVHDYGDDRLAGDDEVIQLHNGMVFFAVARDVNDT